MNAIFLLTFGAWRTAPSGDEGKRLWGPGATHHLSPGRLYFILIYTSAGNVANKSRERANADAEPPPTWWLAVAEGSMRAWQRSETSALTCYAIKGGRRRRCRRRSRNEIRVYSSIYAECLILRSPSANDFSPDITARSWMAFSPFFLSFSFPAPLPLSLSSFDDDDDDDDDYCYWATGQSLLFSVI